MALFLICNRQATIVQAAEDHPKTAGVSLIIDDIMLILEEDGFELTLERFYTESQAWELQPWSTPQAIRFEEVNTITIEGWVLCLCDSPPELVSAQNLYGHPNACITLTQSTLSYRDDLPPNGRYFSLTIPVASLLLRNQIRIQIHTKTTSIDVALVHASCTLPASRSYSRYISIITSGRTGSTLLAKALNTAKELISYSTESNEQLALRSALMSLLNGITIAPISRANFTGYPETYLEPPFDRNENPRQSLLSISNLERIFSLCWNIAFSHYLKMPQTSKTIKNAIIVEKNWCSPIFPLISQRLGILNVVLLRHPVDIANSIVEYRSRTGYAIPYNASSEDDLVEYMEQICKSLDWLAKYTPNKVILKYEDLKSDPLGEVSLIIKKLDLVHGATCSVGIEAFEWSLLINPTKMHQSDAFRLSRVLIERIEDKCSNFIETYYSDQR